MPNTRADLERLKHHWKDNHGWRWEVEHIDELLAMAERLVVERDELITGMTEAVATLRETTAEILRLKEGIEDIADRLDGWTDHDGVGPEDALRALLNPEGSNAPSHLTCIRCGQTFPEHELSAHLATCE